MVRPPTTESPPHDGAAMTDGEPCIRSRHTTFSLGLGAFALAGSMTFLLLASGWWVPRVDSVMLVVLQVSCGLFLGWGGLIVFTGRYRISLSGIDKRDVFGHRSVEWLNVDKITVVPNYFGAFNLDLSVRGARKMRVLTSVLGNKVEVAKTVVEAATTANPQLVLVGWWVDVYGAPPFGIFQPDLDEKGE